MDQLSFVEAGYQSKKRRTRRAVFLARMEQLIPWPHWKPRSGATIPRAALVGHRILCPSCAGPRLSGSLPDEATILNFRHFLERHGLGQVVFALVTSIWQHGLILREGSILDASIIAPPLHQEPVWPARPRDAPDPKKPLHNY